MLLLEGDAGIGKTALWQHGVAIARERLYWVLGCRAVEAEAKLGYTALGDLLGPVLDETLAALPDPQRRALEVALLRVDPDDVSVDPRSVSLALLGVLRWLGDIAPVVVAVDDVQWLDGASAGALAFALRRLEHEHVGFLATRRSADAAPSHFGAFLGGHERMAVGPLEAADAHRLLQRHLGATFPPPTLHRLHRVSGGNPFFLLELARAIRDSGSDTARESLPLPDSLSELLRARVSSLRDATRAALVVAAALAEPTTELVAAAVRTPRGLSRALADAERAGVIGRDGERIRFAHPLLASVVYADTSPGERRWLHARLAAVVEDPEERAKHLALAADEPDEAIASALDQAARRARARGALDEAATLEEQAWRLTPLELPDAKCMRAVESARHHFFGGDRGRAQAVLEEAIAASPPGPPRAHALHLLGRVREIESVPEGKELQARAQREAGGDLRLRVSIEKNLFYIALRSADAVEADAHAQAEVEFARRAGDPGGLAIALADAARAAFVRGREEAWRTIEHALELERFAAELWVAAHPSCTLAWMFLYADDLDASRREYESLIERARERGEVSALASLLLPLSTVECLAGRFEAAARLVEEADDIATQFRHDGLRVGCLWRQAGIAAHTGRVAAARASLEEAALAGRIGDDSPDEVAHVRGFIELSLGAPSAAAAALDPLVDRFARSGIREPGCFRFLPDLIEALVAVGELEEARRLLEEHEARARAADRGWALATAGRCRGLLEAALGEFGAALGAIEQALGEHERVPMPFERARTLLVKGVVERRAKRRRAARDSLEQALAIFEQLGTPLWAEKARTELARVGGRPSRGYELTPTEQRVAQLVAEGRTNREVAATLFMSVKTVEANLSRIYGKLGVRSRTELASKAAAARADARKT